MQLQNNQLTDDLRVVLNHARREAERRHATYLDVEHLMLGLLQHDNGFVHQLFRQHDLDMRALYRQVAHAVGMERDTTIAVKGYTNAAQNALERMQQEAQAAKQNTLNEGHLLLSLLQEPGGALHDLARSLPFESGVVRDALRDYTPPTNGPSGTASEAAPPHADRNASPRTQPQNPPAREEFVLIPTRPQRKRKTPAAGRDVSGVPNWVLIAGGLVVLLIYLWFVLPGQTLFTFAFVLVGWVFSVTLHEFAHAAVAYIGGDHTVREKGYLSFNPLKYTHPLLSIVLPLVFLAIGGIGLPGGAVYIERHRLKSQWWGAAVSAAGPIANFLLALLLALPFLTGVVDIHAVGVNLVFEQRKDDLLRTNPGMTEDELRAAFGIEAVTFWNNPTLWAAVAFLAMLQFTAVFFNLIPIPPLDGFGIIEPYLTPELRMRFRQIGMMGIFLIFFLFLYIQPVQNAFWSNVYQATDSVDIPGWMIDEGYQRFMFWRFEQ